MEVLIHCQYRNRNDSYNQVLYLRCPLNSVTLEGAETEWTVTAASGHYTVFCKFILGQELVALQVTEICPDQKLLSWQSHLEPLGWSPKTSVNQTQVRRGLMSLSLWDHWRHLVTGDIIWRWFTATVIRTVTSGETQPENNNQPRMTCRDGIFSQRKWDPWNLRDKGFCSVTYQSSQASLWSKEKVESRRCIFRFLHFIVFLYILRAFCLRIRPDVLPYQQMQSGQWAASWILAYVKPWQ